MLATSMDENGCDIHRKALSWSFRQSIFWPRSALRRRLLSAIFSMTPQIALGNKQHESRCRREDARNRTRDHRSALRMLQ